MPTEAACSYIPLMNLSLDVDSFRTRLESFEPESYAFSRAIAFYSAAITLADDPLMTTAMRAGLRRGVAGEQLYEVVLQSYLFLGFPRMLIAADSLNREIPDLELPRPPLEIAADETREWIDRGVELCKEVYDKNYNLLKSRVEGMAPEIFRWMVFEGYGKVLSRPGLEIVDREMAIVACLIMENRPSQLYSHMRGALNVGAHPELLATVVADIGESAGEGHQTAQDILSRLGIG
ncbi:MAG: carboxymuconolactone decarboxylase family protein [bacterium]|nr:carboxymuconolactone decarboxylase family protein [bacterium]